MRAPQRSLAAPHANEPNAMTMKLMVMANEMPARDQPVSADIGARNTASENMAPIAMHPIRPPRTTMTQRYGDSATGDLQQPTEGRAFHVAGSAAGGGVTQSVAHRGELANGEVELISLLHEHGAIDVQLSVGREHTGNLAE